MAYIPKRPRGYWDSILNVKSEVDDFIEANGLQPGIVPSLREVRGADRCQKLLSWHLCTSADHGLQVVEVADVMLPCIPTPVLKNFR